jgi:hypothetical protein
MSGETVTDWSSKSPRKSTDFSRVRPFWTGSDCDKKGLKTHSYSSTKTLEYDECKRHRAT